MLVDIGNKKIFSQDRCLIHLHLQVKVKLIIIIYLCVDFHD